MEKFVSAEFGPSYNAVQEKEHRLSIFFLNWDRILSVT